MTHAHKIFIRSKKEDSVFIYHIFEAFEGIASYSTLDFTSQDPYRDLELLVSEDQLSEVHRVLESLGDQVTILKEPPPLKIKNTSKK